MLRTTKEQVFEEFLPGGLPTRLYRFSKINQNLHKGLSQSYLWHASRKDFNDPYDCYKHLLTFEPTSDHLTQWVKRTSKLQGMALEREINYILSNPSKVPEAYINTLDDLLDTQGICCFASEYNNTLMWSHYAHYHQGVCLVYETANDLDSFFVFKVRYTDDFVPRNYFEDEGKAAMIMLTTKSKSWEYENEYRSIQNQQGAIPCKREALVAVIFGCKTSDANKLEIVNTIETSGYKQVNYLQAFTLPNSFKLDFAPWVMLL